MTTKRIAPVLSALLDDLRTKTIRYPLSRTAVGDLQILRLAQRELRDMKGITRAAVRWGAATFRTDTVSREHADLARAVRRLSRSSHPRRSTRRKAP